MWTLIGLAVVIAAAVAFLRWQTADAGVTNGGEPLTDSVGGGVTGRGSSYAQ